MQIVLRSSNRASGKYCHSFVARKCSALTPPRAPTRVFLFSSRSYHTETKKVLSIQYWRPLEHPHFIYITASLSLSSTKALNCTDAYTSHARAHKRWSEQLSSHANHAQAGKHPAPHSYCLEPTSLKSHRKSRPCLLGHILICSWSPPTVRIFAVALACCYVGCSVALIKLCLSIRLFSYCSVVAKDNTET